MQCFSQKIAYFCQIGLPGIFGSLIFDINLHPSIIFKRVNRFKLRYIPNLCQFINLKKFFADFYGMSAPARFWCRKSTKMNEIEKFIRIILIDVKIHQKNFSFLGFEDRPILPLSLLI